ncbi:MAG: hypothetical protein Q9165_002159 [Trypethelium subeluteriae]
MDDGSPKDYSTDHTIIYGFCKKRSAVDEQVHCPSPYKVQRSSLEQDMPSAYKLRKVRDGIQKQQAMASFGKGWASNSIARCVRRMPSRSEVRALRGEIERRRLETKEEKETADGLNDELALARHHQEVSSGSSRQRFETLTGQVNAKEMQEKCQALKEFSKIKEWAGATEETLVFPTIEQEVERLKKENAKLRKENESLTRELNDARGESESRAVLIDQEQKTVVRLEGIFDQLKSQLVEKDQKLHSLEDQVQQLQGDDPSQRYDNSDQKSDWSMDAAGGSSPSPYLLTHDEKENREREDEEEDEDEDEREGEEKMEELVKHPSVHTANSDKDAQSGLYPQSQPQSEESIASQGEDQADEFLGTLSVRDEEKSDYALVEETSTLLALPDQRLSWGEQVEQLRTMDSEVVTVALSYAFAPKTFSSIWRLRKWPLIKSDRWRRNPKLMNATVEAVKRSPEFKDALKWLPQPDSRCSRERKIQMLETILPEGSWKDAEEDEDLAGIMNQAKLGGKAAADSCGSLDAGGSCLTTQKHA